MIKIARWPAVLGLLAAFAAGGCASKDTASDNNNRGGIYGGISAGGTRP